MAEESASDEHRPTSRPPRPATSDQVPPPLRPPVKPAGAIKAARGLWLASFAVGALIVVTAFFARDAQVERLSAAAAVIDPGRDAETLEAVAMILFWGSLGALALIVLVEAILLRVMMRRHGWVRWVLLVALAAHLGIVLLVEASVVAPDLEGIAARVLLVGQLLLAGAGLIVSALPGTRWWFRAEHQASGPAPG